jgi:hypothetical protein
MEKFNIKYRSYGMGWMMEGPFEGILEAEKQRDLIAGSQGVSDVVIVSADVRRGYHRSKIPKGTYGEFSKVEEELAELRDAQEQGCRILELVEITDLYGALAGYVEAKYGMTMDDVKQMAELTRSSFRDGTRS